MSDRCTVTPRSHRGTAREFDAWANRSQEHLARRPELGQERALGQANADERALDTDHDHCQSRRRRMSEKKGAMMPGNSAVEGVGIGASGPQLAIINGLLSTADTAACRCCCLSGAR